MELVTSKGASSSFFTHQSKKFNVFLSFTGIDTRRGFTSHLYHALCQRGIDTFIDNDLKKGDKISDELINIIENSTMSIVIFSENYASSTWCLDELAKIVECRKKNNQLVQPVFYMVEPSYVRYQRGKFEEALIKHEERFKNNVQRWRDALNEAAGYSGWHFKVNDSLTESDLIQKIVEDTFKSKLHQMPLLDTEYEVGIKPRVGALIKRLGIESNDDVHMVAIYGLGGVGKTTMARATYNKISYQFKAKAFLENVRERSKTHEGIIHLQETLLNDISRNQNSKVNNVSGGTSMIYDILRLKRVLIILDDVDDANQIKNLLGKCDWFAPGSRIIMTTRNKQLLDNLKKGVSTYKYYDFEVKELDDYEALELFRKHAFPSNILYEDYLELENQVIHYAKGLPLALKVMGVDLCGKPIHVWKDALDYYENNPHEGIQKVLERSYEELKEHERIIFLDIACFLKGYDMNYDKIKDVLNACGLNAIYGIQKLIDKCLLTIDQDNYLLMHDLLKQMGMDIVRREAPEKLAERSRLWCFEEAFDVVTKNMICAFESLAYVDFSECELITEIPDLSMTPNIKELYLRLCENLVEIDDSVGRLRKLEVWDLAYCFRLRTLPSCLEMNTLRIFNLLGCSSLNRFPEILHEMTGVKILQLPKPIELPLSFGNLTGLTELFFRTTLAVPQYLPGSIHSLQLIERLSLWDTGISELPPSFGNLTGLEEFDIGACSTQLSPLPGSIYNLQHLETLILEGNFIFPKGSSKYVFPRLKRLRLLFTNRSEVDFIFNCCSLTLEELDIGFRKKIVTLPESISRFERLHRLRIYDALQEIPRLPQSIRYVDVSNCRSLDSQSLFHQLREIIGLPPNLPPCLGVTSDVLKAPHSYTECFPLNDPIEYNILAPGDENEIPNWFNHQRVGNSISFSIGSEFPTIALCLAFPKWNFYDFLYICVNISINGSKREFGYSKSFSDTKYGLLCFGCRSQSSLQKLFQDLNLGDQNHVEIFCKTFCESPYGEMFPKIKAIGVHVECNCPQPQNGEALGLSMDNYEARSCKCLCGAQTCCRCLKEQGSMHSPGRASVHSSNLESQIISSDTNGGRSSLVSVPSNSGLPMDVTNGSETLSLLLDLTQPLVMGLTWVHLYK